MGAAAVELVQVGSLYHDDVIDEAQTRRTVESVNARWGNLKAILAGDFLLAKASEIAASLGTEVAGLLAATIGRLCDGEVRELQSAFDVERTEADYYASIDGKTAALFATVGAHRRDRRRARPADDRRAHRVRPPPRRGLPDRRRRPRSHGERGRARQAGGPRPRRRRLHASRHPHPRPRQRGERRAPRSPRSPHRGHRAREGARHRPLQRGRSRRRGRGEGPSRRGVRGARRLPEHTG